MIRRTSINVVMLVAICIFFSVLIALAGVTKENGIDRPGSDYSQIFLQSPDPNLCADLCVGDPNCKAYTYTKPGIDGPQAHCWFKNAVPNPVPNKNCISGVKI